MDRFSELISKGTSNFNYTTVAPSMPEQCPVCRSYNNIFSIATDTHMSCLDDGRKVITGHMVSITKDFDKFIWSCQYAGVNFHTAGCCSFADWMSKHGLKGHYETLNNDTCYVLEKGEFNDDYVINNDKQITSFTTESSIIPQPIRLLTKDNTTDSFNECIKSSYTATAKAMNESRYIYGNNWQVVNLSDDTHIVGVVNGKSYKI